MDENIVDKINKVREKIEKLNHGDIILNAFRTEFYFIGRSILYPNSIFTEDLFGHLCRRNFRELEAGWNLEKKTSTLNTDFAGKTKPPGTI